MKNTCITYFSDISVTTEDENTVSLRETGMLPVNHSININFPEGTEVFLF